MPANIYLVRHAQTLFNKEHRMQGSSDSRLTKLGKKQIMALRDYFFDHGINFDKAYCSVQERSCDTLELLTDHQLPYERIKELKEKDYGFFEGKKVWLYFLLHKLPLKPSVESNRDVIERMERGMNLILRDAQDGDNILVVGHGDAFSQYLRAIVGVKKFRGFQNAQFVKLVTNGQTLDYASTFWPAKNIRFGMEEKE